MRRAARREPPIKNSVVLTGSGADSTGIAQTFCAKMNVTPIKLKTVIIPFFIKPPLCNLMYYIKLIKEDQENYLPFLYLTIIYEFLIA